MITESISLAVQSVQEESSLQEMSTYFPNEKYSKKTV